MRRPLLTILTLSFLYAQNPPSTDIHLFRLEELSDGIVLTDGINITDRAGYDNQPHFTPDSKSILYTTVHGEEQSNIYRYDIRKKKTRPITRTLEAEYSPTVMPDGKHISSVRIEADGVQRLWQFDMKGKRPKLVLPDLEGVGYHVWANEDQLALFVVGDPVTLHVATLSTGTDRVITTNIGRGMGLFPNSEDVSYIHKDDDEWWLCALDIETGAIRYVIKTLERSEDYVWLTSGHLLMGKDNQLYRWSGREGDEWQLVYTFAEAGLQEITRLACSPDGKWLAVVSTEAQ